MNISFPALEISLYLFSRTKVTAHFKRREKLIGQYTRLRENEDLPI